MTIIMAASVDPGLKGAWALLSKQDSTTSVVDILPMPVIKSTNELDIPGIVLLLSNWSNLYGSFNLTIESQQVLPNQGISSGFKTGKGFGILLGVSQTLNIPYKVVAPKQWQKPFPSVSIPDDINNLNIKDTKKRSLALCLRYFPHFPLKTNRGRYRDEFSDAILLSYWSLNF